MRADEWIAESDNIAESEDTLTDPSEPKRRAG